MPRPVLRNGYTTGTTATLAALAAMSLLLEGHVPAVMQVPLPAAINAENAVLESLELKPACAGFGPAPDLDAPSLPHMAHAGALKDGGDDPDVTDRLMIYATLFPLPEKPFGQDAFLEIAGGPGVGLVTRPGLPIPPGEAAINPVPRAQIRYALKTFYNAHATPASPIKAPFKLVISVPRGEETALKTLNPRLGIVGGISILGRQGIVRPFSNSAFRETIREQAEFANSMGLRTVCLSTGRHSEALLMGKFPGLPEASFIQAADFARFALSLCGKYFQHIIWGCFFGKLLKLACGNGDTNARSCELDLDFLAGIALEAGLKNAAEIGECVTASHALEMLKKEKAGPGLVRLVLLMAKRNAETFACAPVHVCLFNPDGSLLMEA